MSVGSRREAPGLVRSLSMSTLGTTVFRLTGAIGGLLSARLLGPSGKGQYALLILFGTAVGTFATSGLQFWVAREVARPEDSRWVTRVVRRHAFATSLGILIVGAVALQPLVAADVASPAEVGAVVFLAIATVSSMVYLAVPCGLLRMGSVALTMGLAGSVFVVWVLVMGFLGSSSVALVVLGAAASNAVMVPLASRHVRRLAKASPAADGKESRDEARRTYRSALRFGLPASAGELLTLATFRLDLVLVALFLTRSDVGLYAVAASLSELLWLVPDGVAQVLTPHVANDPGRRDTGRMVGFTIVITCLGAAGLLLVSGAAIPILFGRPFRGAGSPLPPLLVGAVAVGAWKMLAADVVGRGHSRARATSALTGLLVMVGADMVLIPRLGILGAGMGAALGYLASAGHVAAVWRRLQTPDRARPSDSLLQAATV